MNGSYKMPLRNVRAFTLMELLVTIAIIAILAALLLPVLSMAKARAKRIACISNLKQIDTAVLMYSHDNAEILPDKANPEPPFVYSYKELVKSYLGLSGTSSVADTIFACPAERQTPTFPGPSQREFFDYSSYPYNNRMMGKKAPALPHPSRTALVMDFPALFGYSWHKPQKPTFKVHDFLWNEHIAYNNALNPMGFVDGHIDYIKIYCDGKGQPWEYDPSASYDYQWSGN